MDWIAIKENYPFAFSEFMKKKYSLVEFWEAYNIYVSIRILESIKGEEYWDFKIESKLIMYNSLCMKTIKKDGKKNRVFSGGKIKMKIINELFNQIELQIKDNNYYNN